MEEVILIWRIRKQVNQICLEVRDIILNFKNQKAPVIDGIMTDILQKVGPALWRKIHGLIKVVWKYP